MALDDPIGQLCLPLKLLGRDSKMSFILRAVHRQQEMILMLTEPGI